MRPNKCSKYSLCSAPLCPLDPYISERTKLSEEPKCRFLTKNKRKFWEKMLALGITPPPKSYFIFSRKKKKTLLLRA